jgi:hypothetical protein
MTNRRFEYFELRRNPESLPSEFGADLVELDRVLGDALSGVDVPVGAFERLCEASAKHLEAPASLWFESHPAVVVVRERSRRTMWARVAVAASLTVLVTLASRPLLNSGGLPDRPTMGEPEVMQASFAPPLQHDLEMLLLDRAPDRRGEEMAYLFDPDLRESSDMSLYVQTRDVTADDVSLELAMLESELRM